MSHGPYDLTKILNSQKDDKKINSAMSILSAEVQTKKNIEPETTEKASIHSSTEDLLENLYWNLHGGHMFHLCCVSETNISDKV